MKNITDIINAFPFLAEYYDRHCGNFQIPTDESTEAINSALIIVENDPENDFRVVYDGDEDDEYIVLTDWED